MSEVALSNELRQIADFVERERGVDLQGLRADTLGRRIEQRPQRLRVGRLPVAAAERRR